MLTKIKHILKKFNGNGLSVILLCLCPNTNGFSPKQYLYVLSIGENQQPIYIYGDMHKIRHSGMNLWNI